MVATRVDVVFTDIDAPSFFERVPIDYFGFPMVAFAMRRNPAPLLLSLAVLTGMCLIHEARAGDIYVATLAPGADAGTLAVTSSYPRGGAQLMLRCDTYEVTHKLCAAGTCSPGANDSRIDADKSTDICALVDNSQLAVYRLYDGGVPNCRLYVVNPKTVCPP